MKKKDAIILHIKNKHREKIEHYRLDVYSRFLPWAKRKFKATEAEVQVAYHKAFEIFSRKIKANEFRSTTATPETFLFGIGKNCMLKIRYPKKLKIKKTIPVPLETIAGSINSIDEKTDDDHTKKLIEHYFKKLPPHCADLIRAKKLEGQSIAQIMKEKNYKNANATKVAISKCFKCLKKIAIEGRRKG